MKKNSQTRRLRMVMAEELRLLAADRSFWVVSIVFLLLIGYALSNGIHQATLHRVAQAAIVHDDLQRRAQQLVKLEHIMTGDILPGPFDNPADPTHMGGGYGAHHAILPPAPLAAIALGQDDLFPSQYKVTYESKISFIGNNDIENPWNLLSGHFDLSFVVVYLLPFLIFALGYNLLSGERESGTLRLLMSQPLALWTLLIGKVVSRAGILLALAVLVPAITLLLAQPGALGGSLLAPLYWLATVGIYALFWFALVLAVNACGKSSATNAMVLIIAWVTLVLVLPAFLNLAVNLALPSPSRAELATRTRVLTAEAMARNNKLLSTDYAHVGKPGVLVPKDGSIQMAGRLRGMFFIEREVDQKIAPELARFDRQQDRRQALVVRYSFLSPAAVAAEAMSALAGTGQRRHAWFMQQTSDYHAAWKQFFFSRIDAGKALAVADFANIPRFSWREEDSAVVRHGALLALAQLLAPCLLLLAFAGWRLRRYQVV
ncbi:ABC transporter permease subunit [Janthinobacterium agaricidamnosum]|uniref:Putative membrane protein n=1 Tax=Janthinobacterium agaricidamnosum NBRC 102515 = DSM 9628 TaxID=1349767 RepID=W0V9B1_9BURK|nr:ABC transporter permease subunit [Janthinobacterium agaricidamnosum]CDG84195.1 putative membrane protein [Janthinobacterium agaricidamnosum NBRC 102515 = DSM 9628]